MRPFVLATSDLAVGKRVEPYACRDLTLARIGELKPCERHYVVLYCVLFRWRGNGKWLAIGLADPLAVGSCPDKVRNG